jgi:hypothetical protein
MNEATTLETLRQAKPLRSSGAPERAHAQYGRILALLRERGGAGVLARELYDYPEQFGRSPRNRISELRQDGHLISGQWEGKDFRYCLLREAENSAPSRPHVKSAKQSGAFFEGQRATGLPLFDGTKVKG